MSQRAPDALAGARQGGGEQTGRGEVSVRCPLCDADRYREVIGKLGIRK